MSSIKRSMGTFSLMMTGLGSIIGSGWLFGAWRAAGIAGPLCNIFMDYWDDCHPFHCTNLC